jgi:hypothetical protein
VAARIAAHLPLGQAAELVVDRGPQLFSRRRIEARSGAHTGDDLGHSVPGFALHGRYLRIEYATAVTVDYARIAADFRPEYVI